MTIPPLPPIAVSSGSLYPLPSLQSIQQLREINVRDVELTLQANEFFLTFERKLSMPILPELLRLVESGDLRVGSVHAPGVAASHAGSLWARREYLSRSLETCQQLGGSLVVIHPLHLLSTQEAALEYLSGTGTKPRPILLPGAEEILERAYLAGITLALENIQDWFDEPFFNTPENVSRFLKEMNHPALGFTLDLMHARVVDLLDEFVEALAEEVVNVHVSDLQPPTRRVSVGKGVIDWEQLVPALQALPRLRQLTVELSNPQDGEVQESIKMLKSLMTQ
jgi:sugar phosphate isomerase/epimerase